MSIVAKLQTLIAREMETLEVEARKEDECRAVTKSSISRLWDTWVDEGGRVVTTPAYDASAFIQGYRKALQEDAARRQAAARATLNVSVFNAISGNESTSQDWLL